MYVAPVHAKYHLSMIQIKGFTKIETIMARATLLTCHTCCLFLEPPLPEYSITTNGTVVTVDGSEVKPACLMDFNYQMANNANSIAATADTLIGGELCPALRLSDVFITSVHSTLQFTGNQVRIYLPPTPHLSTPSNAMV